MECEIAEIKSELVYSFQDVMSNFPARFPENTNLQAFDLGEGTPDLGPIIAATERRASTIEFAVNQYKQQVMPLGFVARLSQASLRDTYLSKADRRYLPDATHGGCTCLNTFRRNRDRFTGCYQN